MAHPEQLLQLNMFTGELDDNRTSRQKKADREREQPQQMEMFSPRDVAQFGVDAHPLLPLSPNTRLLLISEDPRSEEDIEHDIQRAAEEKTYQLFTPSAEPDQQAQRDTPPLALVVYETPCLAIIVTEQMSQALIGYEWK